MSAASLHLLVSTNFNDYHHHRYQPPSSSVLQRCRFTILSVLTPCLKVLLEAGIEYVVVRGLKICLGVPHLSSILPPGLSVNVRAEACFSQPTFIQQINTTKLRATDNNKKKHPAFTYKDTGELCCFCFTTNKTNYMMFCC